MLQMGAAGDEGHAHIGNGGAGQHAPVDFFTQMGEDQALPVQGEIIGGDIRTEDQSAARGQGLQQKVDLCIMTQGLKMPDAFHRGGNGLPVENAGFAEGNLHAEAVLHPPLQHLQVDLSHGMDADFPAGFQVFHLQKRLLLGEKGQGIQHLVEILLRAGNHPAGIAGPLGGLLPEDFVSQAVPRHGPAQAGNAADFTGAGPGNGGVLRSGIQADLPDLFRPGGFPLAAGKGIPDLHFAPGDLQEGEAGAGGIPGDPEHPGAEFRGQGKLPGEGAEKIQQGLHALIAQGRAEETGEEPALPDQGPDPFRKDGPFPEILVQADFIAKGGPLQGIGGGVRRIIHKPVRQDAEGGEEGFPVPGKTIHLVYEDHHRNPAALQQLPEGAGVGLNAFRGADDQHGQIHDADGPLGLPGEIRMTGGINENQVRLFPGQPGFLGEDGDSPLLLHPVRIQEGVPPVHPALFAQGAAEIQHGFGQGGFPRVHVSRQAHGKACRHECIPPSGPVFFFCGEVYQQMHPMSISELFPGGFPWYNSLARLCAASFILYR